MSSGLIGIGGLASHPLCILAVMVFWSGWMFFTWSPFSPYISMGLSPVWAEMSSLIESSSFAEETRIATLSCVGGWMVVGSGV